MTNICISRRSGDSAASVARLTVVLEEAFGPGRISCAGDDSVPDDDGQVLECRLRPIDALLAVIGPEWLAADENGQRRLDAPGDGVGAVLRSALATGKPVWPVLVDGAAMPAMAELPAALHGLARRPPVVLGGDSWGEAVAGLVDILRPRPLPQAVRQTAAWELTAAASVLVATLLIADSCIVREVAQLQLARAPVAALAANQASDWNTIATVEQQAEQNVWLTGGTADSLALAATESAPLHLVDDGGWPAVGQLQLVSLAELAAGAESKAAASNPGATRKGLAISLAQEKSGAGGATLPLSFVSWQNKP